MAKLKRSLASSTAIRLFSGMLAAPVLVIGGQASANCTTGGALTTCTAAAPNPYVATVGAGSADNNHTVDVGSGAIINTPHLGGISLGDGANITVRSGATVTSQADSSDGDGHYGTGLNTIEFNSNGVLVVESGASVIKTGDQQNGEAVNVHGPGNTIINHGLISAQWSGALWFQDLSTGTRNIVDNYGQIVRDDGGGYLGPDSYLFGSSSMGPDTGIVMINRPGALLYGHLYFYNGDDDLRLFAGSTVTGNINGGGGYNRLFLDGAAGTQDQLAGHFPLFQALIKEGEGQWTVTGSLAGYETTTVRNGVLTLTGDNSDYTGATRVEAAGTLEGRAQSLPVRASAADNLNNIENNGVVRFTQPAGDDATYAGQITGAGIVEKTGGGVVTLTPDAGANTYSGGVIIREGAIAAAADSAIGAGTGPLTLDGGEFRFASSFTLSPDRATSVTASNGAIGVVDGATGVIGQTISGPGALTKSGDGTLILTGNNTWAGGTTIAAGVLQLGDGGTSGALIGNVANQSQLVFNRSDTVRFDGVISGAGSVTQAGSGATILTALNTWSGPTHVRAGTLAVGGPDSTGAAIAGAGAIDVAAGATLGGYGRVAGDVTNAGVIAVANALSAFSGGAGGNFTIGGQLANSGLVRIGGGGTTGNTLTVGGYNGLGGAIAINTWLGGDGSPSDRLIINGGAGTGNSILAVTNVGGPGAATPGNGIQVISAINGATTTAGAFSMTGPLAAGPYQYALYRGSRDASDPQSWYLRSQGPDAPPPDNGGGGKSPVTPDFRRETSLYAALPSMALLYGQTMLGTLHERVGEQELQRGLINSNGSPLSQAVWGRVIGTHGRNDGNGVYGSGPSFSWDFYAFQIGMDLYRKEHADGSRDHAGVYIGAGQADGDVRHYTGGRAGDMRFDAYTVGAYWTHYGATGWYLDAVAQGTWYNAKAASGRVATLSTNGFGVALSLEGGYPVSLGNGWTIEPQAQILLQKINFSGGSDGAAYVKFSDVQSVAARVGARLSKSWVVETARGPVRLNAWLRGNVWNEFAGSPKANFSSDLGYTPFRSDMKGAWADISAGLTAQISPAAALYASASYQRSFDGRRDGWGGKAGLRITW